LSGVSKWPLPQMSGMGMGMGSRIRSKEKHTTSVLVAPKHAPATNRTYGARQQGGALKFQVSYQVPAALGA
jgi:hypothetical protein